MQAPLKYSTGFIILETAVKANSQVEMRIEMGRGVVPAKAGTNLRCCYNLINGFPPSRE